MGFKRQSSYLHKQQEWKELYESGLSYTAIGKREGVHYTTVQTVLKGIVKPRPKQKYAHLAKEWVKLYTTNELSANQIADQYKTDVNTVSKYLKLEGVELRRQYGQASKFESDIPKWVNMYKEGLSLKEIADQYGTYPQTVHKHIKDKVELREYSETSKIYTIKERDYLEKIDSHEKAYWLGVWFGTGFLSKSIGGYEATLVVSTKDILTLERFNRVIGNEKPIEFFQQDSQDVAKVRLHDKVFYEALQSHGLVTNKSDELDFPSSLSTEFINSFALGYYEGKGSLTISQVTVRGYPYTQTNLSFYGSEKLLSKLRNHIEEQTGIRLNKGIYLKRVHYISTSAKENLSILSKWLYQGNTSFLPHRDVREKLSTT